jgi:hypothetical protein
MRPSSSSRLLTDWRLSFSGRSRSVLISRGVFRLERLVDTDAVSEAMSASSSGVKTFVSALASSSASRLATMDGTALATGLVGEPCVENFETGIRMSGDLGVSGVDTSGGTSISPLTSLTGADSADIPIFSASVEFGEEGVAENFDTGRVETAGAGSAGAGSATGRDLRWSSAE